MTQIDKDDYLVPEYVDESGVSGTTIANVPATAAKLLNIPFENIYVTFSEHKGEDFHLHELHLRSWQEGENPLI